MNQQDRDFDLVEFLYDISDGIAEECGGYPIAFGLALLLWGMLIYVGLYR